ncbi:MAG: 30S ribosomal protein S6e [Candidatus Pacearchaeota archaeon]|nr:30S ribosomal protein S6e [Candidatus Pacearchaeota archaeon]
MVFKINLSEKNGKTFKLESEAEGLIGKSLHDKILGNEISPELAGYEFEITGASDIAGFPSVEEVEGIGLKKILLKFGRGLKKRPKKEGKKKRSDNRPKGFKLRKTVRGKTLSQSVVQVNMKVLKEGNKKLAEVFPEQNKAPEKPAEQSP